MSRNISRARCRWDRLGEPLLVDDTILTDAVVAIIADRLGVADSQVSTRAVLVDDLGADSLGMVDLALAFEAAFDITIQDEEVERVRTVGEALECVRTTLHRRAAVPGPATASPWAR